jgi:hypothetical protein
MSEGEQLQMGDVSGEKGEICLNEGAFGTSENRE